MLAARSRPVYNRGESGGLGGNWPDGAAGQGTGENSVDGVNHLAKVRVAGSNPVFRSKEVGLDQGRIRTCRILALDSCPSRPISCPSRTPPWVKGRQGDSGEGFDPSAGD